MSSSRAGSRRNEVCESPEEAVAECVIRGSLNGDGLVRDIGI